MVLNAFTSRAPPASAASVAGLINLVRAAVALVVIVAGDPGVIPDLLARDCRGGGRLHDPAAITRDEAEAWFTRWRCRDDHAVGVGRPSGRLR